MGGKLQTNMTIIFMCDAFGSFGSSFARLKWIIWRWMMRSWCDSIFFPLQAELFYFISFSFFSYLFLLLFLSGSIIAILRTLSLRPPTSIHFYFFYYLNGDTAILPPIYNTMYRCVEYLRRTYFESWPLGDFSHLLKQMKASSNE